MSAPSPILILQMQRMGDLVLSFPLLAWLGGCFPGHPLWVVGERAFFEPLMPLSPNVTYFSYNGPPDLRGLDFRAVINLSHRPESALLAGKARTGTRLGPWRDEDARLFIGGDWQLYRASLTHNNQYNLFHWSDLNALDIIPTPAIRRTGWPRPRPLLRLEPGNAGTGKDGARIGLFLGASEPEKHPGAAFWAALVKYLLHAGHKPVLLGGKAELPLGRAVTSLTKIPAINLCGRFSVSELARFLSELDLCITPDTGPMHIAAWTGTPTLNLSMGPVNPWETGPFSPGHHILRAALDCAGCWRCTRERVLCGEIMEPAKVAAVAAYLFSGGTEKPPRLSSRAGSLELLRTTRDAHGLYFLERLQGPERETGDVRQAVSLFWRAWFGHLFQRFSGEEVAAARAYLVEEHPQAAEELAGAATRFVLTLARAFRTTPTSPLDAPDFWQETSSLLRPLSGYIQMYVQNAQAGREACAHALSLAEEIAGLA